MNAFDQVFEEFSRANPSMPSIELLSEREQPTTAVALTNGPVSAAQKEFASTSRIPSSEGNVSSEERSASIVAKPNTAPPTAQKKSPKANVEVKTNGSVPEGERSANEQAQSIAAMPIAQISASTIGATATKAVVSKRRRQAMVAVPSTGPMPAGNQIQQSESQACGDIPSPHALGDGDGAHFSSVRPEGSSPVANNSSDRPPSDIHSSIVAGGDEGAHSGVEILPTSSPLVSEITQLWRMRQRWHRAEKSLILQGKAVCRSWTAGDRDEASKLYDRAAKGEAADPILAMALMPFQAASARFGEERAAIEKRLRKLAQSSPLWPWVADVKGFGPLNLAAVIGEAGEIADYRNPSCLWKRMGLAVISGGRQRRVADAEAALEHGYAPARRCVAYLLGDTLIKSGDACRYRPVYAERKAYEIARTDEAAPKSQAHAHNRAARYMVKRVLRNLWSEARRLREVVS